jgi:hypothetical protein
VQGRERERNKNRASSLLRAAKVKGAERPQTAWFTRLSKKAKHRY